MVEAVLCWSLPKSFFAFGLLYTIVLSQKNYSFELVIELCQRKTPLSEQKPEGRVGCFHISQLEGISMRWKHLAVSTLAAVVVAAWADSACAADTLRWKHQEDAPAVLTLGSEVDLSDTLLVR